MQSFIKNIKHFLTKKTILTYDEINTELRATLIDSNIFSGGRSELTKTITPHLQISNLFMVSEDSNYYQMGLQFTSSHAVAHGNIDQDGNVQSRMSVGWGPLVGRLHGIWAATRYGQAELDFRGGWLSAGIKFIAPSHGNLLVFNGLKRIGKFKYMGDVHIGGEVVTYPEGYNIALSTRLDRDRDVIMGTLHQHGHLRFGYFRQLGKHFQTAAELSGGLESPFLVTLGLKLDTNKATVKTEISNDFTTKLLIEEKLADGFNMNINVELNNKGRSNIGIGISIER
ncbi:Mitochondrial import receptor subunit tom40 [Astathelohania contejeani]|uniref:Mitochondrial import receptor subunit tom40 n=1 Tax=Astathelohania contejeani TaxID=164912 RepID=A0ABQ7HYS7_9MICR|nr:Mitochondrial import receptor subunit tom40 [Thelohania contejeani]